MRLKLFTYTILLISLMINHDTKNRLFANDLIIDDRSSADFNSNLGSKWRLVTDDVMGGLSEGNLTLDNYKGRDCLRMRGDVTTENNGGFVQIALSLSDKEPFDATAYTGIEFDVSGNNESYNVHFRTDSLWFPWQSYRYSFTTSPDWQTHRMPFSSLAPYKTTQAFSPNKIIRIGMVAIGREFKADLCLASIKFYSE